MDFCYRQMKSEDKEKVLCFLSKHFGNDSIQADTARFNWQILHYPWGSKPYLCEHNNKIAGFVCFLPTPIYIGEGQHLNAGFGIDLYVDPKYRKHGIASKFHEIRLKEFDVSISVGASQMNAKLIEKLGWVKLADYFSFKLVSQFPKYRGNRRFLKDLTYYLYFVLCNAGTTKNDYVLNISKRPPEMSEELLRRGTSRDAFVEVNRNSFEWRYVNHPYYVYTYVSLYKSNKLRALFVFRFESRDICALVDFYVFNDRPINVLKALARSRIFKQITGQLSGVKAKRLFRIAGFGTLNNGSCIRANSNNSEILKLLTARNFMLFMGDSDIDR